MKVNRIAFALIFLACASLAAAESDASSQALALYQAIQKQNWRALYYLAAYAPGLKKQLGTPDKFAADVQKGIVSSGNAAQVNMLFSNMKNVKVGKAAVSGNKATVPTSSDVTVNGKTLHFHGSASMIKDGKTWKWDLSYSNDIQKATADSLQKLIGKPGK